MRWLQAVSGLMLNGRQGDIDGRATHNAAYAFDGDGNDATDNADDADAGGGGARCMPRDRRCPACAA